MDAPGRALVQEDLVTALAGAFQRISHRHPAGFVRALRAAHARERSAPARAAISS